MTMILGISGSPRKNGNSDSLLRAVLDGAEQAGASTEALYLRDMVYSPCVGCERCRKDQTCTRYVDDMTIQYAKILKATGLVLCSPAHNYNISALLKAFLDRMYCFYNFTNDRPRGYSSQLAGQGRVAVIAGVSEQPDDFSMGATMEMMRLPLQAYGYEILHELPVRGIFDVGAVRKQQEVMECAAQYGRNLGERVLARTRQ